jgi:HSP20 family protein
MSIDDFTISLEHNTLVIAGERKAEASHGKEQRMSAERWFGKFQRAFLLPVAVEADRVEAKYVNGVLTVTVPKAAAAQTKRIAVQAA